MMNTTIEKVDNTVNLYYKDKQGYIFFITSKTDNTITYTTSADKQDGWYCTCEDYKFRKHKCKHIKKALKNIKTNNPNDYEEYKNLPIFVN